VPISRSGPVVREHWRVGLWVPEPELDGDESIVWRRLANRTQGWRAVGGRLTLTSRLLVFKPHRFDRATRGHAWTAPRDDISAVGLEPRSPGSVFGGGLRVRLRVDLEQGGAELFVVRNPIGCTEELRVLLNL
jgi:hypothetical protein